MSQFNMCGNCGHAVPHGADECPQCGRAMFARDRKFQTGIDGDERKRREREAKFTADHEQQRYGLEPQGVTEPLDVYCARINEQKTPSILAEHRRLSDNLDKANARRERERQQQHLLPERIPGADDDKPQEVSGEQAA